MKYLGIDFGSKRVGISTSNDGGDLAFPKEVMENNNELVGKVADLVEELKIEKIVIGHSQNFKMEDNPIMESINDFIGQLSFVVAIPVELEPEFRTSEQAAHFTGRNEHLDAQAAAVILQSYIDRQRRIK